MREPAQRVGSPSCTTLALVCCSKHLNSGLSRAITPSPRVGHTAKTAPPYKPRAGLVGCFVGSSPLALPRACLVPAHHGNGSHQPQPAEKPPCSPPTPECSALCSLTSSWFCKEAVNTVNTGWGEIQVPQLSRNPGGWSQKAPEGARLGGWGYFL